MCEENTYDIIEWKSCDSFSEDSIDVNYRLPPDNLEDIASTTDIVFPLLFHKEATSEGSVESEEGTNTSPLHVHSDGVVDLDDLESPTVYQKVANWVHTQKRYFRQIEEAVEDDELEVIDPADLFHESILNDYWLVTENESERRLLLRDFESYRYHVESIEAGMQTHEYKFLREPRPNVEMELVPLKDFHLQHRSPSSTSSTSPEKEEETLNFLGVPRLLENYVILNREGYVMENKNETDLWLSPLHDDQPNGSKNDVDEDDNFEIDFLSSWFSDVYQDLFSDDLRTSFTIHTDIYEKATVISVSDEEVWEDAPDIPHWLDDDYHQGLELFNQPSKPLYYYRDRIKGCYRIIGVEDETVVLFSGNDDDTIFYGGDDCQEKKRHSKSSSCDTERLKNDSGIEEDDVASEDVTIKTLTGAEAQKLGYNSVQLRYLPCEAKESGFFLLSCFLAVLVMTVYNYNQVIIQFVSNRL